MISLLRLGYDLWETCIHLPQVILNTCAWIFPFIWGLPGGSGFAGSVLYWTTSLHLLNPSSFFAANCKQINDYSHKILCTNFSETRGPWRPCNAHLSIIAFREPDLEMIKENILTKIYDDYINK